MNVSRNASHSSPGNPRACSAVRVLPQIVLATLLVTTAIANAMDGPPLPVKAADDGWRPASDTTNWIDNLPFKILFDQSLRYNDNLLLLPNGAVLPPGVTRGDAYSVTTFGLFSRFPLGANTFFVNGTYGVSRYEHDSGLNASNYAINGGMDWVFTSRCSGTLVASDTQAQAPIEELTSFTVNNLRTAAFKENAKCQVSDHINVVLNSGISRTNNSLDTLIVNDFDSKFLAGGLEYAYGELNTIGVRTTLTKTDYFNRSLAATPGLATGLNQAAYELYYHRVLSAKLEVDASGGVTQTTVESPGASSSFSGATYSVKVIWSATPKLVFSALLAQSVAPPQNIVADFEKIRTESLSVSYLFSPRLTFAWSVGLSSISNPTASGVALSPILVAQKVAFTDFRAIYQVTPLLNATGEYRYTERKDETAGTRATSNLFLLGLTYQR
jgi:Putative beta-barrel porin 2